MTWAEVPHQTIEIFPTVVHTFPLGGVVDAEPILSFITQLRAEPSLTDDPGAGTGQFDFMSRTDLHLDAPFAALVDVVLRCSGRALDDEGWRYDGLDVTECWANVSGPQNSHRSHIHPNSLLSAVWFAASPPGSGQLEFRDTRSPSWLRLDRVHATPRNSTTINIHPEPGLLVLFPSWLGHGVTTNEGEGDRISIALNIMPTGHVGMATASFTR